MDTAFSMDGDKIHIPIAKVIFCDASSNPACSKKQRDWTLLNAVHIPPIFTEATIIHGESDGGKLLKIFSRSITKWAKEGETVGGEDNDDNEDSKDGVEEE